MKTAIRTIVIASLVAIASLSQALIAQSSEHSLRVNVPFAFECGRQHLPAGTYDFSLANQNVLSLRQGTHSAWMMIETSYDPTQRRAGYVVFHRYGNTYFLSEYVPHEGSLHALGFRSGTERKAARDFTASRATASQVQVAGLSR